MRGRRRASVLTTLVFTDIVSSTEMAEEMGDGRLRELLARHYEIIRRSLREHGGKELDTAGDGVFARFDSPAAAVRWASAVVDAVRELGIEIRVGIHIGEAELLQGKLSGINVHAAALSRPRQARSEEVEARARGPKKGDLRRDGLARSGELYLKSRRIRHRTRRRWNGRGQRGSEQQAAHAPTLRRAVVKLRFNPTQPSRKARIHVLSH